jgi:hypothetical protein
MTKLIDDDLRIAHYFNSRRGTFSFHQRPQLRGLSPRPAPPFLLLNQRLRNRTSQDQASSCCFFVRDVSYYVNASIRGLTCIAAPRIHNRIGRRRRSQIEDLHRMASRSNLSVQARVPSRSGSPFCDMKNFRGSDFAEPLIIYVRSERCRTTKYAFRRLNSIIVFHHTPPARVAMGVWSSLKSTPPASGGFIGSAGLRWGEQIKFDAVLLSRCANGRMHRNHRRKR